MKYGPSIVHTNFSIFSLDFHVVGGLINDRFPHSGTLIPGNRYMCLATCSAFFIMQFRTFIAHADIDTQLEQFAT